MSKVRKVRRSLAKPANGLAKAMATGAAAVAGLLMLASLTACSNYDGVEFNGKIFNLVGLGGHSRASEPKLARRNGLVVPPDNQALPAPGSGRVASQGQQNWPKSLADNKQAAAAKQQAIYKKYCADTNWWKLYNPDEFDKMTHSGDLCQSSLSKIVSKKVQGQ